MLAAVSHIRTSLAKMTLSTRRVLVFVRDHSGPFSTSGLAAALRLCTRTIRRANTLLKHLGIASVSERMTSKGRIATWSYDLDLVPEEAWSHADTGLPIAGEPRGVSAWLKPRGGRCQKGGLKALGPRFNRGGAALVEYVKARRKGGGGRGRSTRELSGSVTTPEQKRAVPRSSGVKNSSRPLTCKTPRPGARPRTEDTWSLAEARQRTDAYGPMDTTDFGLYEYENEIVDAYLGKLAERGQGIRGRFLDGFRHLVNTWLVENDPGLVAQALQSILDGKDMRGDLAAYHLNTIEAYGWQFILAKVRTPYCEALGLWK